MAAGNHAEELYELSDEELQGFMQDVKRVCRAVAGTVHPEKINLGLYGDTCKHVHWHIVPKQKGGPDFGGCSRCISSRRFCSPMRSLKL